MKFLFIKDPISELYLSKLAEVNKNIAQTIYDYIIKEQNTFNIKESTKEGKIKLLVWLSNHFQDEKKFIDYEKQSWISQLPIFIQILKEYNVTNNIDSSKFPKNVQAICNRLRKAKTPLLEGLGIEIKVDRITSGIGNNKKLKNTAIVKIRKRFPLPHSLHSTKMTREMQRIMVEFI